MDINLQQWIAPGMISALVSAGTFFFARMRDAEERGALKQRVTDLEKRQDSLEKKIDKVLEKLDSLVSTVNILATEHKSLSNRGYCEI